jgi:phytoene desaturase
MQTGPFRPNNVDARIPGVVFTGSSTVPGVGVPMVLVSGKLAAQRVDELAKR